ncbi:calcineurin-like phosphoesterase family protein [Mucilaginibacter frigoritolerans]|uniref:Calcineurin-like phosphoesterase family protein n=1 Tax=Mucilaginibacter frigoritolerans TaxID=652788 RepID=A0A562TYX3_9SPHI|nr:metallophosphoesterase [Mucilaginibacter frigoritolerans]TWI98821.1 calcineurin-like phosphoesterase family protein [Mucilaginibacter frigoritolerans]
MSPSKPSSYLKSLLLISCSIFILIPVKSFCQAKPSADVEILFTSDAHFGITRKAFRGDSNVKSPIVNAAMVRQMNALPGQSLPSDGGVEAGQTINGIDYLIEGGDIANRMEIPIQSAAASWAQFETTYMGGLKLKSNNGAPIKFLIVPGNHDISNAIGYSKPMKPLTDPTSMVKIYNLMLKPTKPITNDVYNYATDKINYSRDIKGIHFMFITLWADSAERIWMEKDLAAVAKTTPVIIVCHDQPTCEAKHFTNPIPPHNMTIENKFENLTAEYYKEGKSASEDDGSTAIEQRGFVKFLKAHPNIKAYLHGNSNWNEFYTYTGPDNDVALPIFRVDSPMKGKFSAKDETKLSFHLISIDTQTMNMTVRECLWNTKPTDPSAKMVFGASKTISLVVN